MKGLIPLIEKYFEINTPGVNIRCKAYSKEKSTVEKAVVCCTGFAGHKDNLATRRFAEKLLSKHKDVMVLVFNWPAHGDDVKKKLVLDDCMNYLDLVIHEAQKRAGQIYTYATSFGGYLVLKYVSEHDNLFQKIVLRCPAVNMYDVLTGTIIKTDEYEHIMKGKDSLVGFDRKIVVTRSLLDDLKANDIRQRDFLDYSESILILHGTADEVVPFADSRDFAENNLIEFIPVEGADHRFQNPVHMSLANKYAMEFMGLS